MKQKINKFLGLIILLCFTIEICSARKYQLQLYEPQINPIIPPIITPPVQHSYRNSSQIIIKSRNQKKFSVYCTVH
jgi:hypothetical protein